MLAYCLNRWLYLRPTHTFWGWPSLFPLSTAFSSSWPSRMVNKYRCVCVVIDRDLWVLVSELCGVSHFTFSADIQFWNSRQSLEGLSVRSIIFGVFQSLVVLLYILDNETNFVVQVSVFIGLLIDFWKITKVMDVRVRWCHCQAFRITSVKCQGLNCYISLLIIIFLFLAGQREQDCWNFPTIDI